MGMSDHIMLASLADQQGGQLLVFISFFLIFLLGACFGSYANAAAMRLVRDEDSIAAPSRCRFCETPLRWSDNIPILGWLSLKGRSRCCHYPLPLRYLATELMVGCIFTLYFLAFPLLIAGLLCLACVVMVICFLTDLEAMVLHVPIMAGGALAGLIIAGLGDYAPGWLAVFNIWPVSLYDSLIGYGLGAGLLWGTNALYLAIRGKRGFGAGDVWLMGMVGSWLGPVGSLAVFFGASFVGAVAGIGLILVGRAAAQTRLPFGLFLSIVFILYPFSYMLLN